MALLPAEDYMVKKIAIDNRRKHILVTIVSLLIIVVAFIVLPNRDTGNEAINGIYLYTDSTIQALTGEWAFVWDELLTPEAFSQLDKEQIIYVNVPGMWNNYKSIPWNESEKKGIGCGTFKLDVNNIEVGKEYGLKIKNVGTAGRVFINGEQVLKMGSVSKSETNTESDYRIYYLSYTPTMNHMEIIVQISNYSYARGGFWSSIYIGNYNNMMLLKEYNTAKTYSSLGILLSIFIISLTIAIFSVEKKAAIYLLVGTCIVALLAMVTGDKIILTWFPKLNNKVVRIQYAIMFLAPVVMVGFIKTNYNIKDKAFNKFHLLVVLYSLVMMALTLLASVNQLTKTAYFGNLVTIIVMSVLIIFLIREALTNSTNIFLAVIGFFFFALGTIHDFFFSATVIQSIYGELTVVSYVIFMIISTLLLAKKLKKSYEKSLQYKSLESAYYNMQIKPHFLFNVLNSIITLMNKDVHMAEEMTLNLASHLRNIIGPNQLKNMIPIEEELKLLETYINIEMIRFRDINIFIEAYNHNEFYIPPYTLQPLVENAIKYAFNKNHKNKEIYVNIQEHKSKFKIEVIDNGIGMTEKLIDSLEDLILEEDRDTKLENHVGLWNVNQRLRRLCNERLQFERNREIGTAVFFIINK